MTIVYAIHAADDDKLEAVKAEMATMGSPTIRVVNCSDYLMALDGSHRLAAADALGIVPNFEILEQDDMLDITGFDWFDACNWDRSEYEAGDVAGELFSVRSPMYRF